MQTLATYRLETPELDSEQNKFCFNKVKSIIEKWMLDKGATDLCSDKGCFNSLTKDHLGTFTRKYHVSESGMVDELILEEPTQNGHTFVTAIWAISTKNKIVIFSKLNAKHSGSAIVPIHIYPKCPVVIRRILESRGDWSFGGNVIPKPVPYLVSGEEGARSISDSILSKNRTLPIILISEVEGDPAWPAIPESLAKDLTGLATVAKIDEEASWALNDYIGKENSCYLRAIRLYWPIGKSSTGINQIASEVWTAKRLLSNDADGYGFTKFRNFIRRKVMNAAVLSFEFPLEIRQIQKEQSIDRLEKLENLVASNSEEVEIARLFIQENEYLKDQLDEAYREIFRQASRAEQAESALDILKSGPKEDEIDIEKDHNKPEPGEVRFYKKIHSKHSYDVLVEIKDCEHNTWQCGAKADKAKKGIERLEKTNQWKNLYHCGICKGGGVWKVIW